MNRQIQPEPIEILLVEDNEDDIIIIKEALAESRLLNLINVVHDGEEALEYLHAEGRYAERTLPGLVLLDINMPKKNGFEVLDDVKSTPKLKHIPVVMLTVSDREADVVRSYTKGACSYVRKPVDFDKLTEVVKKFELYWSLVSQIPRVKKRGPSWKFC